MNQPLRLTANSLNSTVYTVLLSGCKKWHHHNNSKSTIHLSVKKTVISYVQYIFLNVTFSNLFSAFQAATWRIMLSLLTTCFKLFGMQRNISRGTRFLWHFNCSLFTSLDINAVPHNHKTYRFWLTGCHGWQLTDSHTHSCLHLPVCPLYTMRSFTQMSHCKLLYIIIIIIICTLDLPPP